MLVSLAPSALAAIPLNFSAPVTLPLTCPSTVCRYGGSTAADGFHAFSAAGDAVGNVLGVVNHTAVHSADSGATWAVRPELGGWIGPGLPYTGPDDRSLTTVGGPSPANQTGNRSAHGTEFARLTASPIAGGAWSVSRTLVSANMTWLLPSERVCSISGYSGSAVRVRDGVLDGGGAGGGGGRGAAPSLLLKPWVVKTNCSTPPSGWGVLAHANIWLFESTDGVAWRYRSRVVSAAQVVAAVGAEEGANENDLTALPDGRLLCIFRVDGGDGWPSHSHKPFMKAYSSNQGRTWTDPVSLSPALRRPGAATPASHFVGSARPMLLQIPGGPLLLSGGRPYLMLWASEDGGDTWEPHNLAAEHNRRQPDPTLRFCDAFANGAGRPNEVDRKWTGSGPGRYQCDPVLGPS